jgi:predicted nucleic acid-binding protein
LIRYLADSDWTIDFLNGRRDAEQLFRTLAPHGIGISIISYAEVYEGCVMLLPDDPRLERIEQLPATVEVTGIDIETSRIFGTLRSELRRRGALISDMDLFSAATALRLGAQLISRDRHFDRIPGLARYSPA